MSEILLLRLSADPAHSAWQRVDRLGNLLGPAREGSLALAADAARGAAVWCVVPQDDVRTAAISVPVKDRRRARQAALFALEDRLLAPLDDTHVAQADRSRDGNWSQIAVAHERMRAWITALAEVGLSATRMLSESELFPVGPSLHVLWEQQRVLALSADGRAVTCKPGQAADVISRLRSDDAPVRIWSAPGQDPGSALAAVEAAGIPVEHLPMDRAVVAWMADQVRQRRDLVDLLQGPYRDERGQRGDLKPWAWVGATAAVLMVVQLLVWVVEIDTLSAQQDTLIQDMETVWRGAMGPGARFDRYQARGRMEIALRGAGGASADGGTDRFLSMLATVASAGAGTGIRIEGLALAPGDLQILVRAPDVSAVQQLASAIEGRAGTTVGIGDVDASGGATVSAQLSIRMEGS